MGSGKFLTHLWRVGMELVISLLEVSKTLSELINLSSDFFFTFFTEIFGYINIKVYLRTVNNDKNF
jgi:hypothetical protein